MITSLTNVNSGLNFKKCLNLKAIIKPDKFLIVLIGLI